MKLPRGRWAGQDEWLMYCFSCNREKLYYNTKKNTGHCHRCKLDIGSYKQLVTRYSTLFKVEVFASESNTTVDTLPSSAYPANLNAESVKFLRTRFLTPDDLVSEGVMYFKGILYFPLRPISPELPKVWIKRGLSDGNWYIPKGENKKPYVFISSKYPNIKDYKSVVVVEGVLDCVPDRYNIPTISILGTNVSTEFGAYIKHTRVKNIYVHLDKDRPGEKGFRSIKRMFRYSGISVCRVTTQEDPGSYSVSSDVIRKIRERIHGI